VCEGHDVSTEGKVPSRLVACSRLRAELPETRKWLVDRSGV